MTTHRRLPVGRALLAVDVVVSNGRSPALFCDPGSFVAVWRIFWLWNSKTATFSTFLNFHKRVGSFKVSNCKKMIQFSFFFAKYSNHLAIISLLHNTRVHIPIKFHGHLNNLVISFSHVLYLETIFSNPSN